MIAVPLLSLKRSALEKVLRFQKLVFGKIHF